MTDIERGTDLIGAIGRALADDPAYAGLDWAGLALVVVRREGMMSIEGFAYLADGGAVPAIPERFEIEDLLEDVNAATARPDGGRWRAALIRMVRRTGRITLDLEWEDERRWTVTPQNPDAMREALRPDDPDA